MISNLIFIFACARNPFVLSFRSNVALYCLIRISDYRRQYRNSTHSLDNPFVKACPSKPTISQLSSSIYYLQYFTKFAVSIFYSIVFSRFKTYSFSLYASQVPSGPSSQVRSYGLCLFQASMVNAISVV